MDTAAHWLPVAGFLICLFAYYAIDSIHEEFKVKHCVCSHKQGRHAMTWVGSARMPNQDWGACTRCLCRAFIKAREQ